MKREWSPLRDVHVIAKLADLSEVQYQNALILHALVELLANKGVLSRHELAEQVRLLDEQANASLPRFDAGAAPAEHEEADKGPPARRNPARIAFIGPRDGEMARLDGPSAATPPPVG